MANKRQIKKYIRRVCGDLAGEILTARQMFSGFDREKVREIVLEIAALQVHAIDAASFAFDKVARDFDNGADYRKARNAYYKAAYKKLLDEFHAKVVEIVGKMNQAMPQEVKDAVKEELKK